MASFEDLSNCFFCERPVEEKEKVKVTKGLSTICRISSELCDGITDKLRDVSAINCHKQCRINYILKRSAPGVLDQRADDTCKRLRSSASKFSFKDHCLFCSNVCDIIADKKKPYDKRDVYEIRTMDCLDSIRKKSEERNDSWGEEVSIRLADIIDLVAAEGRYHNSCYKKFFNTPRGKKTGRPMNEVYASSFEDLVNYLTNCDECQFSLNDLHTKMKEFIPPELADTQVMSEKIFRIKLQERFGDDIIITDIPGKKSIVCFRNTGHKILYNAWYEQKLNDPTAERLRIVKAAAEIIREDIRSQIYDTESYSNDVNNLNNCAACIPDTLLCSIENVILQNRRGDINILKKKCNFISHAIVTATRPKSFLSILQIGLSVYIHRQVGSRKLIDLLHNMGISASYDETLRYESSAMLQESSVVEKESFKQFIFDNADFNVRSIDGYGTFHAMGGVMCITPSSAVQNVGKIKRLKDIRRDVIADNIRKVPLLQYSKKTVSGDKLKLEDVKALVRFNESIKLKAKSLDMLWLCGPWLHIADSPQWSGYMSIVEKTSTDYKMSHVEVLPFINLPPSSLDAIYSAISFAMAQCRLHEQKTCIVTFDQPLYAKAVDLVASCESHSPLSSVIVRLGGFHLLMSFMGSVGYIMSGSGLEELWTLVYAGNSIDKMLSGHSYSRALRAHFMTQAAVAAIVLNLLEIPEENKFQLHTMHEEVLHSTIDFEYLSSNSCLSLLQSQFEAKLVELCDSSRTAKLWVQYFQMVTLMRNFVRAERCGDWQLHLQTLEEMLPFFHSAGHVAYAKSAHLYLQQMIQTETRMDPNEYKNFTDNGFFTIRRTSKKWAGLWSDLTIEQFLMRTMKTSGGLTHGRGLTANVISRWVESMPACTDVVRNFEEVFGLTYGNEELHIELRKSRQQRDFKDVSKFLRWLTDHNPFINSIHDLMNIANGMTADKTVNCDMAHEIGLTGMQKLIGQNYGSAHLKRSDKVISLAYVQGAIKLFDNVVPINTNALLNRILCICRNQEDLSDCFGYELSPYPLSLFNVTSMRKTQKAALYPILETETNYEIETLPAVCKYVLDGGYILQRVHWPDNASYREIYLAYVRYIVQHFGVSSWIIFDGYNTSSHTKVMEQSRRAAKFVAADIFFDADMRPAVTQQQFLSNTRNKSRFIENLTKVLHEHGIVTKSAPADADTLIVSTACNLSKENTNVVAVGTDVDLLVLLLHYAEEMRNLYYLKPGVGKVPDKVYNVHAMKIQLGALSSNLLFLHAMTGCDTTSALYRQGKKKALKLLKTSSSLQNAAEVFYITKSSSDEVQRAGEKFLLALYGAPKTCKSLSYFRHECFVKAAARCNVQSEVQLAALPPTSAAAKEHSFRVFLQVQHWLGNELLPTDWGWSKIHGDLLLPVTTKEPPAPDKLLHLIACNCKAGCERRCTCRKAGLSCSLMCGHCKGTSCDNVMSPDDDSDSEELSEAEIENEYFDHEEIVCGIDRSSYDCREGESLFEDTYECMELAHEEVVETTD